MKRYLLTILAIVSATLGMKAMPYEMAREEALYLTDKMAYELNLNQRQYEYAYEINLDYLMSLRRVEDAYGHFLICRNEDLRHVLHDWQWKIFTAIDYFLHPVTWRYGNWYYPIYNHYARNHFFYSRPSVYLTYRGGHDRAHFTAGFYVNARPNWNGGFRGHEKNRVSQGNFRPGNGHEGRPGMGQGQRPGTGQGQRPGMGQGQRPGMGQGQRPGMEHGQRPGMGQGQRPEAGHGQRPEINRGSANGPRVGMPQTNRGSGANVTRGRR